MSQFRTQPVIEIRADSDVAVGWSAVCARLESAIGKRRAARTVCVIECYPGVAIESMIAELALRLRPDLLIRAEDTYRGEEAIERMVRPDVTDDRIFGFMTRLTMADWFDPVRLANARAAIDARKTGLALIVGTGAVEIPTSYDCLIYADLARWEIQQRMRRHEIDSLGLHNRERTEWGLLYKQGYFVDWRVADRLKRTLMSRWDFVLDTNDPHAPKMIDGRTFEQSMTQALARPFSVVPFFDPGPWGGQWMKDVCGLDPAPANYAWCFNCVVEENSVLLSIDRVCVELPAIDLLFFDPVALLGQAVYGRFGAEFPIRFDFLDTMGGGNLSLQVHPLTDYIREQFGMAYTQDESYYLMDAEPGAVVYLGLKDGVEPGRMMQDLEDAQAGASAFDAGEHVQTWPARRHDHFLIPAGTVHCSGRGCLVLEISATPYIFTFKLWDWGRLGLDGRPRPINIAHGKHVIQWDRTANWTREQLVNRIEPIAEGDGWCEERTGLHELEFIETRRHRFSSSVRHATNGGVNVLCLVEGDEITVESPENSFSPFIVRYAEVFIVPAAVGAYTIAPSGPSIGKECITIKAFVRTHA